MKKISIILFSALFLSIGIILTSCDENGNPIIPIPGLSNDEVILGLKQALTIGTDSSVSRLTATNGYLGDAAVKILLPDEINSQINSLESIAGSNAIVSTLYSVSGIPTLKNDMITALNRSAEDAAKEATPIFVGAITSMSISDGFDILNGPDTAATSYLRGKTFTSLFSAFEPKINVSLDKGLVAGKSANDIFNTYVSSYNNLASKSFGAVTSISAVPLSNHVTNKGLNGLFLKVGDEEKNIRTNPLNRVTDLLERVFGSK